MDSVTIIAPSSSANVGLGYDTWCLGIKEPSLKLTYTRIANSTGIEIEAKSAFQPPQGRELGYAGRLALENFFSDRGIKEGAHLLYEDDGYPVGGLGRSGAEAAAAVIAAAVIYDKGLRRNDAVIASGKGEPGHLDNVAASINGRFNIIAVSPLAGASYADYYDVPENLGIAIGYSSHKKTKGTEGGRRVTKYPVDSNDFVVQTGMISAATAALVTGNTDRFLELAWGDMFAEQRRADIGWYGNFTAGEFAQLKRRLFHDFYVALNVSGAGPNMQFLYNTDEGKDAVSSALSLAVTWFAGHGVEMRIEPKEIAQQGAHDYAQHEYNWNARPNLHN